MEKNQGRIESIWKVLLALGREGSAEQALTEAMNGIRQETGAAEMTLWLLDGQEKRVVAVAHAGEHSTVGYSTGLEGSLVGETVASGEETWIPDTAGDARFPHGNDEITGTKVANCLVLPMRRAGQTVGCLQALNRAAGEYSEEEKAILRSFCGLAAMAVEEKGMTFPGRKDRKAILTLKNVKKDYVTGAGVQQVLKGIDLEIYENEFLVILGESGCGKSTLLNLIGGMDALTDGQMLLDGRDCSHPTEDQLTDYRRDTIGFVFQAYNLMPNLTALENVEFVAENTPNHGDPAEALKMVGLTDKAGNYPYALSGGQQQRVSIARAIVKNPRLILADEPTGALDADTAREVLQLIEKLVKERGLTVVMVTHNADIARMANRVIRLKNGRIASIQENAWPCSAGELAW